MKLPSHIQANLQRKRAAGFTFIETMFSVWIFLFILTGVMVAVQIFGLRVYTLGATKLSATAGALKVLNKIRDDIRGSKYVDVGNYDTSTGFHLTTTNYNQGNALMACSTTNHGIPYDIYYLDTTSNTLMISSVDAGSNATLKVLASFLTNQIVFDAEDFNGNVLTNDANNRIIRMELDFYQWEYPLGFIGGVGVNAYDYYRLTTKISRRDID